MAFKLSYKPRLRNMLHSVRRPSVISVVTLFGLARYLIQQMHYCHSLVRKKEASSPEAKMASYSDGPMSESCLFTL